MVGNYYYFLNFYLILKFELFILRIDLSKFIMYNVT